MRANLPHVLNIVRNEEHEIKHNSSIFLIKDLFNNYLINLLIGTFITFFFSYLITTSLYLPIYLHQKFGFTPHIFFSVMTVGIIMSAIAAPFFGKLGDHYNRTKLLRIIPFFFLLFLFCALQFMKSKTLSSLLFFIFGYEFFIALFSTNCLPVLADLFPMNVRATGIGLCYNLSFSLAAVCPILLSQATKNDSHIFVISALSGCIVLITMIASRYMSTKIDFAVDL